jgi:16S rRNA (cytidine1402-2'-O)-methyltransferase
MKPENTEHTTHPAQLYMVATPIGHLSDISERAIAVLRSVDVIAAEDTRHTGQLLHALGIKQSLVSVHEHNEQQRVAQILSLLAQGQSIAFVSDAGTPAISDPGAILARGVAEAGYQVVPIPGASSVVTALSASGLDVRAGFCFLGFIPTSNKAQKQLWLDLAQQPKLVVMFESPHRIMATLEQLAQQWPERSLVLAKELTKLHERFIRGTCQSVYAQLQANPDWQRGEFVLMLAGQAAQIQDSTSLTMSLTQVLQPLLAQLPLSQAVKFAVEITGLKKKVIYDLALQLQQTDSD